MSLLSILFVAIVILAGSCVQSALGFGTTMFSMGFLPLIMEYSKAMGLSIVVVSISTVYISVKYTLIYFSLMAVLYLFSLFGSMFGSTDFTYADF